MDDGEEDKAVRSRTRRGTHPHPAVLLRARATMEVMLHPPATHPYEAATREVLNGGWRPPGDLWESGKKKQKVIFYCDSFYKFVIPGSSFGAWAGRGFSGWPNQAPVGG